MIKDLYAIELSGISYQNKLNIMRCLLGEKPISRKEVAEICSLSEVTVGKVSSALCEKGLLKSEKHPVGRGRHTDFFSPSDFVYALIISVGEENISAVLFDLSGNAAFEFSRALNQAISYEASADGFCRELSSLVSDIKKSRFIKTAVLFREGISSRTRETFKATALRHFDLGALLDHEEARARALCRPSPNGVVLAVSVRERLSVSIVCGNKILPKSDTQAIRLPSSDPTLLIEQISALLCPLFCAVLPDRIIIESRTILADRSFCESLCESIAKRTNIPKEKLPLIESTHNADCAEREAIEILREQICTILAGRES